MKKQNQAPLPFIEPDSESIPDSVRALRQLYAMHNRIVVLDTHNPKTIDRTGKLAEPIRDLLRAVDVFRGVQAGGKFEAIGKRK